MAVTAEQAEQILATFVDVDLSIIDEVVYFNGWQTYEECGGFLVFRGIDGSLQRVDYVHCVMASDNSNPFISRDVSKEDVEAEVAAMTKYLAEEHDWPDY